MDRVDHHTRSRIMSAIRSKGNKSTEMKMIDILKKNKLVGWRRHYNILGKPDFVWPKDKIALFVDGCFWHGCPFCNKMPKTHTQYWKLKILSNKRRDARITRRLRKEGWSVYRVWECRIDLPVTRNRLLNAFRKRARQFGN